jgi:hypothetical protein
VAYPGVRQKGIFTMEKRCRKIHEEKKDPILIPFNPTWTWKKSPPPPKTSNIYTTVAYPGILFGGFNKFS